MGATGILITCATTASTLFAQHIAAVNEPLKLLPIITYHIFVMDQNASWPLYSFIKKCYCHMFTILRSTWIMSICSLSSLWKHLLVCYIWTFFHCFCIHQVSNTNAVFLKIFTSLRFTSPCKIRLTDEKVSIFFHDVFKVYHGSFLW